MVLKKKLKKKKKLSEYDKAFKGKLDPFAWIDKMWNMKPNKKMFDNMGGEK